MRLPARHQHRTCAARAAFTWLHAQSMHACSRLTQQAPTAARPSASHAPATTALLFSSTTAARHAPRQAAHLLLFARLALTAGGWCLLPSPCPLLPALPAGVLRSKLTRRQAAWWQGVLRSCSPAKHGRLLATSQTATASASGQLRRAPSQPPCNRQCRQVATSNPAAACANTGRYAYVHMYRGCMQPTMPVPHQNHAVGQSSRSRRAGLPLGACAAARLTCCCCRVGGRLACARASGLSGRKCCRQGWNERCTSLKPASSDSAVLQPACTDTSRAPRPHPQ